ncbi:hypothetical protein DID88_009136 [Monilinia fructigena]|uniref:Uncharacterized protein n=1 Tax=Monilinia fructigena TaxID=38457 RepID=A0A395IF53_9HELO|nr:hypothetical protein DID88_009136 [Monilinia fructigena]
MNALSQIEDQEIIPESDHEEDEVDHDLFRPTPLSTPVLAGRNSRTMGKSAVQGVSLRNVGVEVGGSRSESRSGSASASASTGVGTSMSGSKRVAANPLMRAVPAKRARVTPAAVRMEVSDSDSDEDRFRFR